MNLGPQFYVDFSGCGVDDNAAVGWEGHGVESVAAIPTTERRFVWFCVFETLIPIITQRRVLPKSKNAKPTPPILDFSGQFQI